MAKGTIKRLTDKGFGFINSSNGGSKDVFFHASALENTTFDDLNEGDTVEFDIVQGDKGPRAENVVRQG